MYALSEKWNILQSAFSKGDCISLTLTEQTNL